MSEAVKKNETSHVKFLVSLLKTHLKSRKRRGRMLVTKIFLYVYNLVTIVVRH